MKKNKAYIYMYSMDLNVIDQTFLQSGKYFWQVVQNRCLYSIPQWNLKVTNYHIITLLYILIHEFDIAP